VHVKLWTRADSVHTATISLPQDTLPYERNLLYLGKNLAKLDDAEMAANRNGGSNDPKAAAAVRFAIKVTRERGHVSDDDVRAVSSPATTTPR